MHCIGIDIGATQTKFVLLADSKIIKTQNIPTPKTKPGLIKMIVAGVQKLVSGSSRSKISGIGIGVPGPLSPKRDLILNPPNLPCLKNTPLAKLIEKQCGLRVKMENDANCFTLGEALLGAGKGSDIVFGITLGSGTGGGLVVNQQIFIGSFGTAAEVGHLIIRASQRLEELEDYASEKLIKRESKISGKELFLQAKKGNKKAIKIFTELGENLGIGLANVINLIDPEVIVIGGGLVGAWDFILKPARLSLQKRVISPIARKYVKIKKAQLGEFAGAIGAAHLVSN